MSNNRLHSIYTFLKPRRYRNYYNNAFIAATLVIISKFKRMHMAAIVLL